MPPFYNGPAAVVVHCACVSGVFSLEPTGAVAVLNMGQGWSHYFMDALRPHDHRP